MSSAKVLGKRTQPHTKDEESKFLGGREVGSLL